MKKTIKKVLAMVLTLFMIAIGGLCASAQMIGEPFRAAAAYAVTVTANPSNGGMVAGGGVFEENASATVTATANEGWFFKAWTENGETVSTEAEYAFTVTADRDLVAVFEYLVKYPVWVGATQVDSSNKDDILSDGGKVKFEPSDDGQSGTLTLNDPSITTLGPSYAQIYTEDFQLTITGSARLENPNARFGIMSARKTGMPGDLILDNAQITAVGMLRGIAGAIPCGLIVRGENSSVHAKTKEDPTVREGCGIAVYSVEISGGTVTADGPEYGFMVGTDIVIGPDVNRVEAKSDLGVAMAAGVDYTGSIHIDDSLTVTPFGCVLSEDGKTVIDRNGAAVKKLAIQPENLIKYPVWLGDIQVDNANKNDILKDGGRARLELSDDGSSGVLTLNDPAIEGTYNGAQIYAEDFALTVTGSATLRQESDNAKYGIFINFTSIDTFPLILDNARITAVGTRDGISSSPDADITVRGGSSVNAAGGSYGIAAYSFNVESGCTVSAAGTDSNGISAVRFNVSGGVVTATSAQAKGILSMSVQIDGGMVTATGKNGGIAAFGDILIGPGISRVKAVSTGGGKAIVANLQEEMFYHSLQIDDSLDIVIPAGGRISNDSCYLVTEEGAAADEAVIASKQAVFTVTVDADANGKAFASAESATAGTTINVAVIPDHGYTLDTIILSVDGVETDITDSRCFTMPVGNAVVLVTFRTAPETPEDPEDDDLCEWCGKMHTGFFGKIVAFFHSVFLFFARLFGRR